MNRNRDPAKIFGGRNMVNKQHKFLTFILIIILTAGIIGGVFGISYFKGGVTFPWQLTTLANEQNVTEKETAVEPQTQEETAVAGKTETTTETTTTEETTEPEPVIEVTEGEDTEDNELHSSIGTAVTHEDRDDYYGALFVEDGKLVDSEGNQVQLTGVSSHGINWFPEYVSADSIKTLRDDWGVNVIRLAMYTSDYNGYCVGGSDNQETLKGIIDEAVEAATDNDMYVIIDWHTLNDSDPNEYKSDAIQFFGEMVRKYEDYDNVIYEICNEPNGDTTWDDIKKYANEVIPVIRGVDEDAIILVGTPSWSSDLESVVDDQLDFDNIMYTYHFYAASHKSSARSDLEDALEAGLPVFISEYGLVSADGNGDVDTKEAEKWYDLIEENNLSSCIWNLSNKDEGSALISSDCDETSDWAEDDLSEEGQYFYDYIKTGE